MNQLSRLLFDSAAGKWYGAVGIEILSGVLAVTFNMLSLTEKQTLWGAFIVALLSVGAYVLRQRFEVQYDLAETMRRQSLLTEGLNFKISKVQYSEWRRRCGKLILKKLSRKPREENYYQTTKKQGPRKLLEMTQESAFWTRALYSKLFSISLVLSIASCLLVLCLVLSISLQSIPDSLASKLAYVAFLAVPVLLSVNMIGWSLKLSRLIKGVCEIEADMERLHGQKTVSGAEVLRLIFEYNCILAGGFPIPSRLFKLLHDSIAKEWDETR